MKKKVRFLDSVAILGDPKPKVELDAKYAAKIELLKNREKPPSAAAIKNHVDDLKKADRYGEPINGFPRDIGWKEGTETFINADLARKWEEAGMVVILDEKKAA
jgi:hypothetical protein